VHPWLARCGVGIDATLKLPKAQTGGIKYMSVYQRAVEYERGSLVGMTPGIPAVAPLPGDSGLGAVQTLLPAGRILKPRSPRCPPWTAFTASAPAPPFHVAGDPRHPYHSQRHISPGPRSTCGRGAVREAGRHQRPSYGRVGSLAPKKKAPTGTMPEPKSPWYDNQRLGSIPSASNARTWNWFPACWRRHGST
jgi:hypothetical protein